ncbi:MAG: beta-hydroxyacyl-ACP dehydratase [Thermoguttaceae bacterium]|nr:beta-hydroxyacyl-ACP dehydratase [Thermoguttaceae bacterium]
MPKKPLLIDPSLYDLNAPIALLDDIRKYNRQRFEMEQLTAIVYDDQETMRCVGYKDMALDEFWARGHMPEFPLAPGVILVECAAQLASYVCTKYNLFDNAVMGFAGLDEVKFRGMVRPGDRLVIQAAMLKCKKILVTSQFMCLVGDDIVCEGIIKGVPLPISDGASA